MQLSVVFYFPEVLEGVLFTNPQVLLDKATELVLEIYRLREDCSASGVVTAGCQAFRKAIKDQPMRFCMYCWSIRSRK